MAAAPCDARWTYDARDRLLSHQQRAGKTTTYTLDEPAKQLGDTSIRAGNVTTETDGTQTTARRYTGNQLTDQTAGGATAKYWYGPLGNLDCVTQAAGSQANCSPSDGATAANLVTDYAYDYLNRLASVRQYAGGTTRTDTASYTYDALDRVTKEVEDHAGSGNDRTTTFTHQGLTNLVTEERQAGGTTPKTKTFSYDAYGHRLAMLSTDNTSGTTESFTYAHDVHGSVSQLLTDTGTVKASHGYSAYGGSDALAGDPQALTTGDTNAQAPINPYRYAAKRMDSGTVASTGTPAPGYDMGARRFGPDTTRFLQADLFHGALGDLGLGLDPLTQNRYALAGGNPISYMEVDGHIAIPDGGGGASPSPTPVSTTRSSGVEDVGTNGDAARPDQGAAPPRDAKAPGRDLNPANWTALGWTSTITAGVGAGFETRGKWIIDQRFDEKARMAFEVAATFQKEITEHAKRKALDNWRWTRWLSAKYMRLLEFSRNRYIKQGQRYLAKAMRGQSLAKIGKFLGPAGAVLAGVDAGVEQARQDVGRTDLSEDQKRSRAFYKGLFTGLGSWAGGAAGFAVGSLASPAGAIGGAVLGGWGGTTLGSKLGDWVVKDLENPHQLQGWEYVGT